jgi:hypothetical protein
VKGRRTEVPEFSTRPRAGTALRAVRRDRRRRGHGRGPHDGAHHLPAERGRDDLVPEQTVAVVVPARLEDAAHPRRPFRALAAERREVVLPEKWIGAQMQQRDIERLRDPPRRAGEERIGRRPVHNGVAVGAPFRRVTGVEVGADEFGRPHHDLGPELAVDRPQDLVGVEIGVDGGAHRTAHDLTGCVHTGIGAACARQLDRHADDPRQRLGQLTFHRARVGLRREAVEVGAVVRDDELQHLHDCLAGCERGYPARGRSLGGARSTPLRFARSRRRVERKLPGHTRSAVTPVRCAPWVRCRPGAVRA